MDDMSGRVLLVSPDGGRAGTVVPALRTSDVGVDAEVETAVAVATADADTDTDRVDRRSVETADCVVVDHQPPAVDGPEVVGRVADAYPRVPVVLLAGEDGDERLAGRAVDAGVDAYVPGGEDDVDRLCDRVRRLLADEEGDRRETPVAGRSRPDGGLREVPDDGDIDGDVDGDVPGTLKERVLEEAPVGVTVSDPDLPDNPLVYVNEAFEEMTGYEREEALGSNCRFLQGAATDPEPARRMAEAVDADEPVSVELLNYRKDGEEFWNRVDVAPIRDAGEVTHYVSFQTDVTERKRAEFAVERYAEQLDRERAALDRVVDRVQGLVRDAAEALVTATTRAEIAEAVCDLLAETDSYDGAWMSELEMGGERLEVTTAAGLPGTPEGAGIDTDDVAVDADEPATELLPDGATPRDPAVVAAANGEPQTVERVGDLPPGSLHREVAADDDALAAVPVEYRDTCYGVLTVYADEAAVVAERERTVVAALGRMVATAVNAVETKTTLSADDVVTLEFGVADPDLFFVAVSGTLDCSLDHAGTVAREDGSHVVFLTAQGASGETVVETAREHPDVVDADVLTEAETETETLVELVVEDRLLTDLADYGARLRGLSADDGVGHVEVDAPPGTAARSVVDLVEEFDEGDLAAYHERTDPPAPTTRGDFVSRLRDELTDRQLSALQRAYLGGYFEWPRDVDGDELADTMDVSRSTYHQHLRAAERKLLAELFADRRT